MNTILVERKAIKGLSFGILLGWWSQFPGALSFLNYGVLIFEKSGASTMDPLTSSIMLAFAQMMGGIFSTQLADSLGRKLSMIISFLGSAIGLFILSVYLYLNQNGYDLSSYSWIPVACLSFVMFISSAGVYALYAVCFVEHLPSKVRKFPFDLKQIISTSFYCFSLLLSDSNDWINNLYSVCVRISLSFYQIIPDSS